MSRYVIPASAHIGQVRLRVGDVGRSRWFYGDVVGLPEPERVIGLENGAGGPPPRRSTGLYHVAIRFPDRAGLADAVRRVVEARLPLDGASDHTVSEAVYLRDPDGLGVELYRDRPGVPWPDMRTQPMNAPLDLRALLAEAPGSHVADPATDVGHVHLKVADLDRAEAWYRDVLGLEEQLRVGDQAAFLSAGGYHHHVGMNTWESRGAGPAPPGSSGLARFAVRLPDGEALEAAAAQARAAGAAVEPEGARAAVLRDPDGNSVLLEADA